MACYVQASAKISNQFLGGKEGLICTIDPSLFEQAILNMAINARHAMKSVGQLYIAVRNANLEDAVFMAKLDLPPWSGYLNLSSQRRRQKTARAWD